MAKIYQKSAFIFRRDLRLEDNISLLSALEQSEEVIPVFIFDPAQTDQTKNEYFSVPAFIFLLNSLKELNEDLKNLNSQLYIFSGQPAEVIDGLIKKDSVDAVFVNKDYTPFARKRDGAIDVVCQENSIPFFRFDDCALAKLEEIKTGENKIYTIFTPFMKKARQSEVLKPRKNNFQNYFSSVLKTKTSKLKEFEINTDKNLILNGGRKEALDILRNHQYLNDYKNRRNVPADNGTSQLSPHHKFGTISIRESYHMAKKVSGENNHFISELYWRDFYLYIAYHFPQVFKGSFLPWAKYIKWINNKKQFKAWCEGKTGVPMVDAGMRQLNSTGWMHNRSRMIVASYLTKNLLIDWRWGEKYFAQNLIDYDPSQNNGGWQWSASTGADPKPLRIFNPYTQAVNYDNQAKYIKKWVPELVSVETKLLTNGKTQDFSNLAEGYPAPIEDQKTSYHRTREVYKNAKKELEKAIRLNEKS